MNPVFKQSGSMIGIPNIVLLKNSATVFSPDHNNVNITKDGVIYMKTVDELINEMHQQELKQSKLYDKLNDI